MKPEELQSLLRARARVDMPADYTRKLLERLHERQRSELLQRSLWRIAADRAQTFWSAHSMSTPLFVAAVAALLAVGLAVVSLMKPAADPSAMARLDHSRPTHAQPPVLRISPDANASALETQPVSFGK